MLVERRWYGVSNGFQQADRYGVVRYERPVGVVDRDDELGRGACRQSTCDTPFGADPADGTVLNGFVERVGDPVPLVAPDGSTHHADRLLVEALGSMVHANGGQPASEVAIAVPAHWGMATLRVCAPHCAPTRRWRRTACPRGWCPMRSPHSRRCRPIPGCRRQGVIALARLRWQRHEHHVGGRGASFEPIDETTRYADFSGDQIDQALLSHIVDGIAATGGIDPAGTAAVGSLSRLREECRNAKERLSAESTTEVVAELPGYRSAIRLTRTELESLIAAPLEGVLLPWKIRWSATGLAGRTSPP